MKKQKNLLMLLALVSLNNNYSQQRGFDTPLQRNINTMTDTCEGLSIRGNHLYRMQKEEALEIAKPFPMLQTDFVETLAMIFESSQEISGGRAYELMVRITHLLKCREVCFRHGLMREVMGLDNKLMKRT